MLSKASKDVLVKVRQMVPPMLENFHKGEWIPLFIEVFF